MIESVAGRGADTAGKPRLVFFQWDHSPNASAAKFLTLHMEHHVKCLAAEFDVTVVSHDCDYDEICDRHRPDMTLFESGYKTHGSQPIRIVNTHTHPRIPKLGLHNGDAWCNRRSGFLSDMERWGIGSYASIATVVAEYTPEIWDDVFVWPNFIDPEVFRDYGAEKTSDVLITGQVNPLYPWRERMFPLLRARYASAATPGRGYDGREAAASLVGADYARALNASRLVPTCGTMGHEVVRKHFEIPAAAACLVSEPTPGLEAAGFVDMENCVLADGDDIVERLDALLADPDRLARITRAGHDLVHARHTLHHRPQIREWLELQGRSGPGRRIVQDGPFGSLRLAERSAGERSAHVVSGGLDRALLHRGDRQVADGAVAEARASYAGSLGYVSYLPEGHLRVAICDLMLGDAEAALRRLADLLGVTAEEYRSAEDFDPVEWAWLLLALTCRGRVKEARRLAGRYPALAHPELDRAVDAVTRLSGGTARRSVPGRRASVHVLPPLSEAEWTDRLAGMLDACGQPALAERLRGGDARTGADAGGSWAGAYAALDALIARVPVRGLRPNVPPLPESNYLGVLARRAVRVVVPPSVRSRLRALRGR